MRASSDRPRAIEPTWRPESLGAWTAPGGPLHDAGPLDDLMRAAAREHEQRSQSAHGRRADSALVVDGTRRVSGTELGELVRLGASRLAARGVRSGDVVGWQLPNSLEAVVLFRACWRLGAVAAPLHHLLGAAEVQDARHRLGVQVLLDPATAGSLLDPGAPRDVPPADPGGPAWERIAVVVHTSGSSGHPKAALHTHAALAYKARSMAEVHGLGPRDVVLMPAPLAHVSGLLNGVLVPGAVPFRSVLMGRWCPEAALDIIEQEQVTFMVGPPTFFLGLENASGFSPDRVSSLRLLSVGGAGVTADFVRQAAELFGATVKRTYGSTEAPTVATALSGDDEDFRAERDGRAVPGAELRVVDPDSGSRLPAGSEGELWVRGPELFAGYLRESSNSGCVIGDWFRTGDLAVLDRSGGLRITGRLKDVIIRGGENISPAEVEANLMAHPAVRMAVVVGQADPRLGERVCAVVQLVEGERGFDLGTCRSWFAELDVARYRTPEHVVVVDEIPLLASGKADRAAVAARFEDRSD